MIFCENENSIELPELLPARLETSFRLVLWNRACDSFGRKTFFSITLIILKK